MQPDKTIDVSNPQAPELRSLLASENISLKPNELLRVSELLERNPTLVELHTFNIMWSEHCSYKSSKPVLQEYLPTKAPHVVLGPGEDAGIIRFCEKDGKSYCLVLAHESHNHPSQVLPAEGAATGIGGIVRDVYCMGADVIGVMDPLRFGDPEGPNSKRVRDIVRGVVDGIAQYGNALGVPNYGGDTYFDAGFDDNCLVNVVAIGSVAEEDIVRSRAPVEARGKSYDIILIGKPTDASGFGGAAFASERLSGDEAAERQEAVQVPDPFLKRVLAEATKVVLREAKQKNVPIGFKDLGAGGISCAVSEMAEAGGVGATLDLDAVSRFPEDLSAQVIACSETQERYAMFVPEHFTEFVLNVYNSDFDLPHIYGGAGAYVIGHTTDEARFRLSRHNELVCDAGIDAITTGIEYTREKRKGKPRPVKAKKGGSPSPRQALLSLLGSFNIADKSILFQHYDSEVQARAVIRPGEADAAVAMFMPGEPVGVALGIGGNSILGLVDPYLGGSWSVVEAARNVACVGALPLAVTDCLNFGDPEDPEVFSEFTEAVRGIGDACRGLVLHDGPDGGLPVVSGNVSFYNQSENGQPIAPTPIVACAGRLDDASVAQHMGFKKSGSTIALLGSLHDLMAGSEYVKQFGETGADNVPPVDFELETAMLKTLLAGFNERIVIAAHDISHGGVLVTLSEMMLASAPNDIGCDVDLVAAGATSDAHLFSEYGGIVIEIADEAVDVFKKIVEKNGAPFHILGRTTSESALAARLAGGALDARLQELRDAATGGQFNKLFA